MNDPHNICMNAIATAASHSAATIIQNREADHHLRLHHHQQLQPNSATAPNYNFINQSSNFINLSPFNILNPNPNPHLLNIQDSNTHNQQSFLSPNPNPSNFLPPVQPHNFFNTAISDHHHGSSSAANFNTLNSNLITSQSTNFSSRQEQSSSANFLDLFNTSVNPNPNSAAQNHGNFLNQFQGINQDMINSTPVAMESSSAVPAASSSSNHQRTFYAGINQSPVAANMADQSSNSMTAGHQIDQSGEFNDDVDEDCDALFNENGDGDHVISSSTDQNALHGASTAIASTEQNAVNSINGALQSVNENRGPRGKVKGPPAKNLMAERRRRKKLNDRLYTLRSVVPKISKMDRASILGDAIDYLKELLQRINDLHNELEASPPPAPTLPSPAPAMVAINPVLPGPGAGTPLPFVKLEDCSNHSFNGSSMNLSWQSTDMSADPLQPPKIEIRSREGQGMNIHMICARRPGLLLSTMRALDGLGLDVQQAVISCFNGFALDVFRAEQLQEHDVGADEIKRVLFLTATNTDN